MRWLRLYHETPSDPKLRRIAHTSGTTVGHVLAVWVSMMCHASELEGEKRGTLEGWDDTDCAINLGIDPAIVFAIRREMEARLLDGQRLIAWNRRQYDSDSAATRTKRWRDRKNEQNQSPSNAVTAPNVTVTASGVTAAKNTPETHSGEPLNAPETLCHNRALFGEIEQNQCASNAVTACDVTVTAKTRLEETREEKKEGKKEVTAQPSAARSPRGTRLPSDWKPEPDEAGFAHGLGLDPDYVAAQFRDYWHAKAGRDATKLDWSATWRGWCRREAERRPSTHGRREQASKLDWMMTDPIFGAQQ